MTDLVTGEDGKARCRWGRPTSCFRDYHDGEWGWPVTDERRLYEKLCLECLQSGLSWALILRKRDGIRDAFADFSPDAVAAFGRKELEGLLKRPASDPQPAQARSDHPKRQGNRRDA